MCTFDQVGLAEVLVFDRGRRQFESDKIMSYELFSRARCGSAIASKGLIVDCLPTKLMVSVPARCNLNCVMCGWHHNREKDNIKVHDDLAVEMIPGLFGMTEQAKHIAIVGGGEPMMSKSFWKWIALFESNKNAIIRLNTNGLLLNKRNIERLLSANVTFISISCDAASEQMYYNIRGGNFRRLKDNIAALVEARKRHKKSLRIGLNMMVCRSNAHEAPSLVRLAHELGVEYVELMKLIDNQFYDWTERKPNGFVFDYQAELPEKSQTYIAPFIVRARTAATNLGVDLGVDYLLDEALGTAQVAPRNHSEYCECAAPWQELTVGASGDVYPCCFAIGPVGSLKTETLAEIWNGTRMQTLRDNILNNAIDSEICGQFQAFPCPYVQPKKIKAACKLTSLPQLQRPTKRRGLACVRAAIERKRGYRALFQVDDDSPISVVSGAGVIFEMTVENRTDKSWDATKPGFLRLGARLRTNTKEFVCELPTSGGILPNAAARPNRCASMKLIAKLPERPGQYEIVIDVVHEGVCWFSDRGSLPLVLSLNVK